MSYAEQTEPLCLDLAFWFVGLESPDYPIEQLGKLSHELAGKFRALAIMQLLSQGSTDLFLHNLMRAGRARQVYLQRLRAQGIQEDHFAAAGRFAPLLDVIAAGDVARARSIAALSPSHLLPGEYADDHHYARLLHELVAPQPDMSACVASLARLEVALDGVEMPRLSCMRALLAGDARELDDGIEALLDDFELRIEAAKARGQLEEPVTLAQREVCVEALALLRLASWRGIATARAYRHCPELARRPMTVPFPPW
jgi:hypothetical protein